MHTLSAEEFQKLYGKQGAALFNKPTTQKPGITQALFDPIKGGINEIKKDTSEAFQGGISQIKQGASEFGKDGDIVGPSLKVGAGVVNTALSPLAAPFKPVSNAFNYAADKIAAIPAVQDFANSKGGEAASQALEPIANAGTIAQGALVVAEAPKLINKGADLVNKVGDTITGTVKDAGSAVIDSTKNIGSKAKSTAKVVKEKIKPTVTPEDQILKDVTPSYNQKLISEPAIKNSDGSITPRVQEGGLIKGRKITSTPLEKEAAAELGKIKNYPINGTSLEKYQAIQPEITARSKGLMDALKNENILRPPQQIKKVISNAINKVPSDSLLLQKSDPVIKNYMRVAENAISKSDGTLAGEMKVRQLLDAAYKNARGKMAFGSDKLSALDDVHTAARDALNADIIAKAKNVDVKASLKSQWDLMRASDILRDKAEAEASTGIKRLEQEYPLATKATKAVGKVMGIGAGVDLIR